MTARGYIALAASGSAFLLLGALAFQYIGGLAPCQMCIWQRYPHAVALVIGLVAVQLRHASLAVAGAIAALATAGVGLMHVGVEQKWWDGPTTCSGGGVGDLSPDDLLNQIMAAPLVRCDDIAWQFLGLSMAGWNMVISLGLVGLWLMAARRS